MDNTRTVLVTGATSGIGRATARAFANSGATVVVGRRRDLLHDTARDIDKAGGTADPVVADLAHTDHRFHPQRRASAGCQSVMTLRRCSLTRTWCRARGLAPVLRLAERAELPALVGRHVHLGGPGGVNPELKVPAVIAEMVAGADSIDDLGLLRRGAMRRLFTGVRVPSRLGTFLRSFTFGHVRQLDGVASRLLINLAGQARLLPGADELAYVDVDDTLRPRRVYATVFTRTSRSPSRR